MLTKNQQCETNKNNCGVELKNQQGITFTLVQPDLFLSKRRSSCHHNTSWNSGNVTWLTFEGLTLPDLRSVDNCRDVLSWRDRAAREVCLQRRVVEEPQLRRKMEVEASRRLLREDKVISLEFPLLPR